MKKYFFFLIWLHFVFLLKGQEKGKFFYKTFSPQTYKASAQNWNMIQDKRGVFYFGLSDGILEYDGVGYRFISNKTGDINRCFAIDSLGVIYTGDNGDFGYLASDPTGNLKYFSIVPMLPENQKKFKEVLSIAVLANHIYFITSNKIFDLNATKFTFINSSEKIITAFKLKGKVFVLIENKGIYSISGDSLKFEFAYRKELDKFLHASPCDSNCILLSSTYKGLFKFGYKTDIHLNQTPYFEKFSTETDSFFSKHYILTASVLPPDNILIGSYKNGAVCISKTGKLNYYINESDGLNDARVNEFYLDANKSLWIATNNGFTRIENSSPFQYWNKENGLKGTVEDVIRYKGIIYIATQQGTYYLKNNQIQRIPKIDNRSWNFLIFKNPDDTAKTQLLAGLGGRVEGGVWEIIDNEYKQILNTKNGVYKIILSSINPKRIFLGCNSGMCCLEFDKNKWNYVGKIENFEEDIRSIAEEKNGIIWASSFRHGIFKIFPSSNFSVPEKVEHFTEKDGLPSLKNNMIFPFEGDLLIGTEKGLYRYIENRNQFVFDTLIGNKLINPNQNILTFYKNSDNRIWITSAQSTKNSIGYLTQLENGFTPLYTTPFNRLPEMMVTGFYAENSGNVWFGSSDGLFLFNEKQQKKTIANYNVLIRKVSILDGDVVFNGTFFRQSVHPFIKSVIKIASVLQPDSLQPKLLYKYNSLVFECASVFYEEENSNQYSYFLEGFDIRWSDWTKDPKRTFTNLREGKYIFHVKAQNIYNQVSNESVFTFTILPPWYRKWWAYAGYILIFFSMLHLAIILNTRRYRAANKRLEKIVKDRTFKIVLQKDEITKKSVELEQQKEEIQTIADNLQVALSEITSQKEEIEKKNTQIISSIHYAQRIQNAVLPNQATVKKIISEYFILFKPRNIVSGDFYFIKQIRNFNIIAVADCTGHGVPGAFMSMLGIAILNEIIQKTEIRNSSQLLDELRKQIKNSLQQTGQKGEQQDGMDIAFCAINMETMEMSFAGAHNPCWIFRQHKYLTDLQDYTDLNEVEFIELPADHMPVGVFAKEKPFSEHSFQLQTGDLIYLFSDGFNSQFGGDKNGKYKASRFKKFLSGIYDKAMNEQKELLETEFIQWKGSKEQTDDVLVLGIKI